MEELRVIKKKIIKVLNSPLGIFVYVAIGLGLAFIFGVKLLSVYFLIIVGIPILFLIKQQDVLPYLYGGAVLAFLANASLGFALSTDLPVVAVVSGSMAHDASTERVHYTWLKEMFGYNRTTIDSWPIAKGFDIGDLPVVRGFENYELGDVIVFSIPNQQVPIIHRIVYKNPDGSYQTKGDHNPSQLPFETSVKKEQIHGKVIFIVPKIGYFKVFITRLLGGF